MLWDEELTPLEMRRVCPVREQYLQCLSIYHKYELSDGHLKPVKGLPDELDNVGKNLGYHDMHTLQGAFERIELDATNESTRRDGNPVPFKNIRALIKSFTDDQWVYFDSNFNTCFYDELDTKEEPISYFEHYYGDYFEDFIPAKMKEAGNAYGITFMDRRGFWFWLATEGRDYYHSLPMVEMSRLNMDMAMCASGEMFENLGPVRGDE